MLETSAFVVIMHWNQKFALQMPADATPKLQEKLRKSG